MNEASIAGNGIITTVEDLLKWEKALKDTKWFSNDLQVLMEAKVLGNQTFAGEIVQVVMGNKVLEVILAKANINGHQSLILKTPFVTVPVLSITKVFTFVSWSR